MRARLTVTVDPDVLEETKRILGQTGITLSGFVNLTLKGLVDSEQVPLKEMYENMAKGLIAHVTETEPRKKKKKK